MGNNLAPVNAPKRVVWKYGPENIKFGFMMGGSEPKTQCVESDEIQSESSVYSNGDIVNSIKDSLMCVQSGTCMTHSAVCYCYVAITRCCSLDVRLYTHIAEEIFPNKCN